MGKKDMNSPFISIIFISAIVVTIINGPEFLFGRSPEFYGGIASLIFIFIIMLYGIYMGREDEINFILYLSVFVLFEVAIFVLCYYIPIVPLYIFFVFFLGAVYGLEYFMVIQNTLMQGIVFICIPWIVCLSGYLMSKVFLKRS